LLQQTWKILNREILTIRFIFRDFNFIVVVFVIRVRIKSRQLFVDKKPYNRLSDRAGNIFRAKQIKIILNWRIETAIFV